MKIGLVTILFVILLFGCKKDPSLECNPLPVSNGPFGWNYTFDPIQFNAPCFNPNNRNELSFIQNADGASILYTYNTQTKVMLPLYRGNIFYQPDWGINDWILFNVNNTICKIKSNGDSLTVLAPGLAAAWLPNATGYTYPGNGTYFWLASSNGRVIDSFSIAIGVPTTWPDSTLILVNQGNASTGFIVYGGANHVPKQINCSINNAYSGACFINSTEFIWADDTGIYLTNIQTGQTSRLRQNCNAINYLFPSYSSISNKVLWNKVIETPDGTNTLHASSIIVMMNPDGTGEQEVDLP